jgi:hypothetical protein
MRRLLLLDPEGGATEILDHLDDSARFRGGRQPKPSPGRDDHIFLPPHQHGAGMRARGDNVARIECRPARGGGEPAAMLHLHRPGRLGDEP